jgi:hypothetical protein
MGRFDVADAALGYRVVDRSLTTPAFRARTHNGVFKRR